MLATHTYKPIGKGFWGGPTILSELLPKAY